MSVTTKWRNILHTLEIREIKDLSLYKDTYNMICWLCVWNTNESAEERIEIHLQREKKRPVREAATIK